MRHIFPWQQQKWQYLVGRKNAGRLPHALLLTGIGGIGKSFFAERLAELLLCQKNLTGDEACGRCNACQLLQTDNHPDLIMVQPEEQGKTIKIDQIREAIAGLYDTSHQGGYKVVIIKFAELLNIAAANALLKTLEEPAAHIILILVSACPMQLPATIRSRCQVLAMHAPKYLMAQEWLEQKLPTADVKLLLALTENAPLRALDLVKGDGLQKRQEFFANLYALQLGKISSVQMAARCLTLGLESLLVVFMGVVSDLLKIRFTTTERVVNQDQIARLAVFAGKTNIGKLFVYQDYLCKLRRSLMQKINLNQQLTMENVVINWVQSFVG